MADTVNKLKELLFDRESATIAELEQRIAEVARAEHGARAQITESLRQLELIRQLGDESRALHARLERQLAGLETRTNELTTRTGELNARTGELKSRAGELDARTGQLATRFGTPEALRSSVAEVIDDVIVEARRTKQEDLSRALAPMLVKTIKAELRNNQAEMVEALYPITGQLVKSYVASAMRDLTNRLNRGLQSNGAMLRLRSLFSGYSMAELRLAESQQLEIEELYLIRRGSGELLLRFPESLNRSNSDTHMSGVLAAINDFAAQAFQGDGGYLRSFDLDDFTLFLRASPVYLLAAKCRGVTAPGVEGVIDTLFLDAVSRFNETEMSGSGNAMAIRMLADLKSEAEGRIAEQHEKLSSAGMPFSPLRALIATAVLALFAGGGWYAFTAWETERTRSAASETIASTPSMSGYPVTLEVGFRGRSIAVSGLAPSNAARSDLMDRLATALQGVAIQDRGLAALPAPGPDLTPQISSVSKRVGEIERQAARAAALRSLERARHRLQDTLPDFDVLSGLQAAASRRTVVTAARGSVETAIAAIGDEISVLRDKAARPNLERRTSDAMRATADQLRRTAREISALIGQRPGSEAGTEPTGKQDVSDTAELLALAAERLASISAAALQAGSIRIPEPHRPAAPTPLEQLAAYVARHAIFFSNNDDYSDPARANAVIAEIARLARQADVLVRVVGYTDERGGQTRNNAISQARADKVAEALRSAGMPRQLVVAVGRSTGPDLSPATGPGSANRRVQFEIGFDGEIRSSP